MRLRNGFTLVETLIVVGILGLVVLIGMPRMSAALVRNDLRGARTSIVNMMAMARAFSVRTNRVTWVKFEGSTAHVLARPRLSGVGAGMPDPADTVGSIRDFAELYGVGVASDADSIRFDPRGQGMGFGAEASIALTRKGYTSTITIDGLGRVTK